MKALEDLFSVSCLACASTGAVPLEHIDLNEQHRLYAPDACSLADELTRLAQIPSDAYQMLRCQHCGLEFCEPPQAPGDAWYHLVYKSLPLYPEERWEFAYVPRQLSRGDTIGEIGCGDGAFLKRCRTAGLPAIGLDFSSDAIHACLAAGLDAQTINVNDTAAGFIEASHRTAIVAFQVLEHLESPSSLFVLAHRWSTPSASLWVAIPSDMRPARFFRERDYLDQPPHHMTRWTHKALKAIGERNGWRLTGIRYEPLTLAGRLWWIATRSSFYQTFAAGRFKNIRILEIALRALLYPWSMARSLSLGNAMSGQTMMAQYQKS